jgi:hypothetical protein
MKKYELLLLLRENFIANSLSRSKRIAEETEHCQTLQHLLVMSKCDIPHQETFLPVAKKLLVETNCRLVCNQSVIDSSSIRPSRPVPSLTEESALSRIGEPAGGMIVCSLCPFKVGLVMPGFGTFCL